MALEVKYVAHAPVAQPVFSVSVTHLGGTVVSAPNTREAGAVPALITGQGTVTVTFPAVPLLAGTFDVSVAVHDFSLAHCYDSRQHVAQFDVLRGHPVEEEGLITLSPAWRLSTTTGTVL